MMLGAGMLGATAGLLVRAACRVAAEAAGLLVMAACRVAAEAGRIDKRMRQ
jgi:hypothetical protein